MSFTGRGGWTKPAQMQSFVPPDDRYGHGTHVAGLIASQGKGFNGEYEGIAPGVRLIDLEVLDGNGVGQTSAAIDAIDFAIANKSSPGIDILNLSIGHPIYEPARVSVFAPLSVATASTTTWPPVQLRAGADAVVLVPAQADPGSWYTGRAMGIGRGQVSHERSEETPEAKARWFRSLPVEERMELLCAFTDLALDAHPSMVNRRHAQSTSGRVRVLEQT